MTAAVPGWMKAEEVYDAHPDIPSDVILVPIAVWVLVFDKLSGTSEVVGLTGGEFFDVDRDALNDHVYFMPQLAKKNTGSGCYYECTKEIKNDILKPYRKAAKKEKLERKAKKEEGIVSTEVEKVIPVKKEKKVKKEKPA
jgi:hypothetical protein